MPDLPTFYAVFWATDDGELTWDDPWDAYATAEEATVALAQVRKDNPSPAGANVVPRVIAVYRCSPVEANDGHE